MHILMLAAENGALAGGKVGGIADVIRDVPKALAEQGHTVSVITPGYLSLSKMNASEYRGEQQITFLGRPEVLQLYEAWPTAPSEGVRHLLLEHPLFAAGGIGQIYCNDDQGPFATDASKFALLCLAVAQLIEETTLGEIDVLHLHDWHAAPLALLSRYSTYYEKLRHIPLVYTIHNLAIQGIRPLSGHISSLHAWYPELQVKVDLVQDPLHKDCINLMRAGINLADKVHAVSPSYAQEILKPSDPEQAFVGGGGLEADLKRVWEDGRLFGILNGCDYSNSADRKPSRTALYNMIEQSLKQWVGSERLCLTSHFLALERLHEWRKARKGPDFLFTSIGRLTAQKASLLCHPAPSIENQRTATLDIVLRNNPKSHFIVLGSGDSGFEDFFRQAMARNNNLLFLCGFSEPLANSLYSSADLFLMPSSFEPCGISQLLAMRAGTPCLVHRVGGLRDTISNGHNGFTFEGNGLDEQALRMLQCFDEALSTMENPERWRSMCAKAKATRFTWEDTVAAYLKHLYRCDPGSL
ncbi:MAG: glycogen/starch synthase [Pseudohongiellaceae bacterium]|nr:glycogen/starch synthase [Pseudohongiellaceae bacterium]